LVTDYNVKANGNRNVRDNKCIKDAHQVSNVSKKICQLPTPERGVQMGGAGLEEKIVG
jgi:hypothetical protein